MAVTKRGISLVTSVAALAAWWQFGPLPDAGNRLDRFCAAAEHGGTAFRACWLPETESERAVYGPARVVKEAVAMRGQAPFQVTVIDGARNRHAVHDPVYCFRGAGWQIAAQSDLPLTGGTGRWLRLTKNGQVTEAVLWFSNGATRHSGIARFWAQTALRRLTCGSTGPEPVLVVLEPLNDAASPDWPRIMADFEPLETL